MPAFAVSTVAGAAAAGAAAAGAGAFVVCASSSLYEISSSLDSAGHALVWTTRLAHCSFHGNYSIPGLSLVDASFSFRRAIRSALLPLSESPLSDKAFLSSGTLSDA